MDRETSKNFLRCLGVTTFNTSRAGWVTCACPLVWRHQDGSGKASFGLKLGSGEVFVNCYSCDFHGAPFELILEMRTDNKDSPSGKVYEFGKALKILTDNPASFLDTGAPSLDEQLFGAGPDVIFPESWLAEFELAYCAKPAGGPNCGEVHPYLETGRKGGPVPYAVAKALDLRYDNLKSRVCFPVRDYNNKLRGLHGRSIYDNATLPYWMYPFKSKDHNFGEKQTNADVWLGEAWVDPEAPVIVAESVFDLARVYQVYRNVISPLTASLNEVKMKRLAGVKTIVTLYDADKAGDVARKKITERLTGVNLHHAYLPSGFDAGAMPVAELATLLEKFVNLDPLLLHN